MAEKVMGALSLCKKAGRLVTGFDAVCESALKGKASLVLFARDCSAGTKKRVLTALDGSCPNEDLPLTQEELARITRRPVAVLAVEDDGLARLCLSAMQQMSSDETPAGTV